MADIEKFVAEINTKYSESGKPAPIWQNELGFDSTIETLEPIYYWILDFVKGPKYTVKKLSDNFTAAPGSGYFADLSSRATKLQEEGMKILGTINLIIKSVINILYDLKEFEIRLKTYEDETEGKTLSDKQSALLALKDIWMSNVDIKRGRGSINQMTYELGFSTLRDAFMKANSPEEIDKMEKDGLINERVSRILKPRVKEFFDWKEKSHDELRRRFNIEKAYLKSQVDTLKLYSSWVRPYLVAVEQLRMKESTEADLISAFGTMVLNLSLMLTKEIDVKDEADNKFLPEEFKKKRVLNQMRKMYQLIFLDYTFRTYPTQQFPHAGRVDIKFKAYSVNEDELIILNDKIKREETNSLLGLAGNLSSDSLKQIQDEIDYFTKKPKKEEKKKEETMFSGILKDFMKTITPQTKSELYKKYSELCEETETEPQKEEDLPIESIKNLIAEIEKKKKDKEKLGKLKKEGIPNDNYYESVVRNLVELSASEYCFKIFDTFKKSRGMASFPSPFDEPNVYQRLRERRAEIAASLKK